MSSRLQLQVQPADSDTDTPVLSLPYHSADSCTKGSADGHMLLDTTPLGLASQTFRSRSGELLEEEKSRRGRPARRSRTFGRRTKREKTTQLAPIPLRQLVSLSANSSPSPPTTSTPPQSESSASTEASIEIDSGEVHREACAELSKNQRAWLDAYKQRIVEDFDKLRSKLEDGYRMVRSELDVVNRRLDYIEEFTDKLEARIDRLEG